MKVFFVIAGTFLIAGSISCGNAKQLQYLQGAIDTVKLSKVNYHEIVIQTGDILSITLFSDNAMASAIYNQGTTVGGGQTAAPGAGTTSTTNSSGYLVDKNGNIQLQALGNVYVKGMTREQLAIHIAMQYKEKNLLTNPYCQVRFTNFKITVFGEVNRPSIYYIPSEKVNILEVIGLAGDLTTFARRDSILVIRETDQQRKFGWLNVKNTKIFNSEFFYLQQNDVVVINATKTKAAMNDQVLVRNVSLVTSIISSIALIVTIIKL